MVLTRCSCCRTVTVDEVFALGELYKKVSNSLHQVSALVRADCGSAMAICTLSMAAHLPFSTNCLIMQDGVIQKDEFMQAVFHTAPGQMNFFADRVRKPNQRGVADLLVA